MISIIILNYNGQKWNQVCIDSILKQSFRDFEIIFVDNNSSDSSLEEVRQLYGNNPIVRIITSEKNLGFSGGNNLAIAQANGEYILLLNNDTWMEDNFLERFLYEFQKSDIDILGVTEKKYDQTLGGAIILPRIDIFGHTVNVTHRNIESPVSKNLFYTSGVCLLCKKDFYIKTGGLDNDFFMYYEEVDWIWRVRLYGGKIGQLVHLYIYHAGAGSTGKGIQYNVFLWRNENTLQMLLKNYAWYNVVWILPIYFLINIVEIIVFSVFGKFDIAKSYILGWRFNIKYLKRTLKKRKAIQEKRKVGDREIIRKMYIGFGKIHHIVNYFK